MSMQAPDMLRPLKERQCVPGFECRHGFCRSGHLKCVCDRGWVGLFCQTPCTLDCGRYGQCEITPAGQRCECTLGVVGPRCQEVLNVTLLETFTSPAGTCNQQHSVPLVCLETIFKLGWSELHFAMHYVMGKCNSDLGTLISFCRFDIGFILFSENSNVCG